MSQRIVAIDSQRLDAMQYCNKFCEYRFEKNLVPINVAQYLERGSLIHKMLEMLYKLKKHRSRWALNNKTYMDIVRICADVGRHYGKTMQLDISEVEYTLEIFFQYTDFWENDGWDYILAVEPIGSKILFESDELIILYEVKMDLVMKVNGTTVPVDHKHSGSRRDPNILANQFKGYCWFLECNNIIVNEVGFQKTVKPADKFRRHTLSFSQAILEEWTENTIYTTIQYLNNKDKGYFPRNFTSCDKYSGCDFKEICSSDPGDYREFKLRQNYKERVWDPGRVLSDAVASEEVKANK